MHDGCNVSESDGFVGYRYAINSACLVDWFGEEEMTTDQGLILLVAAGGVAYCAAVFWNMHRARDDVA